MKIFHQTLILLILLSFTRCNAQPTGKNKEQVTQLAGHSNRLTNTEVKDAKRVNINYQFRGNCYAYSSTNNAAPSNGEAHSDNIAQRIDSTFPRNGFYMVINEMEYVINGKYLHQKLYMINTGDTATKLGAQDSRLNIIAEALNEKNEWKPISYLPSSWCGNSYHTVVLDTNQYWSFDMPVFAGTFKTKIRYVLLVDNEPKIVSNEVHAYINTPQFNRESKQGHNANSIMDPYND